MSDMNTKVRLLSEVRAIIDNFEYDFSPLLNRNSYDADPIIFPETIFTVNKILSELRKQIYESSSNLDEQENKIARIRLVALMQTGKTRTFGLAAFLLILLYMHFFKRNNQRLPLTKMKDYVLILTHDANNQLEAQTRQTIYDIFRKLSCFLIQNYPNDRVISDSAFQQVLFDRIIIGHRQSREIRQFLEKSQKGDIRIRAVFSDEAHIGRKAKSETRAILERVIKNSEVYIPITATPFEDYMLEVYKRDYFQFPTVFLKPGNGYVSINQLHKNNRLFHTFDLIEKLKSGNKKISDRFWNLINERKEKMENSYVIIRLNNFEKLNEFLELMLEESKLFFKNYNFKINVLTNENKHKKGLAKFPKWLVSVTDINTEFLKNKPDQFTFVFVFQAFRTGAVLDKTHISLLFDSPSKKDDTILQSFLGRACGYYSLSTTNFLVYANLDNLTTYLEYENAVFLEDVNKIKTLLGNINTINTESRQIKGQTENVSKTAIYGSTKDGTKTVENGISLNVIGQSVAPVYRFVLYKFNLSKLQLSHTQYQHLSPSEKKLLREFIENEIKLKSNQDFIDIITIRDSNAPSQKEYSRDFIFEGVKWTFETIHETNNIPSLLGIDEKKIEKNSASVILDLENSRSAVACLFLDKPNLQNIIRTINNAFAEAESKYVQ